MRGLAELFYRPDLFWADVDLESSTALFAPVSRSWYAETSFHKIYEPLHTLRGAFSVGIETLIDRWGDAPATRPVHHLLNTGYCCSTLVTRVLGGVRGFFPLREPVPLMRLATFRVRTGADPKRFDWKGMAAVGTQLLGRTWGDEAVVVKHYDVNSYVLPHFLRVPTPKPPRILFLYTGLDSYLAATLKNDERREWVTEVAPDMWRGRQQMKRWNLELDADFTKQPVAHKAALIWLLHRYHFMKLAAQRKYEVASLDCQTFLDDPVGTTIEIARFFGVDARRRQVELAVRREADSHAKSARAYDRRRRVYELDAIRRRLHDELDDAIVWSNQVAGRTPVTAPMPFPLLAR